jgi:hypothetical protein
LRREKKIVAELANLRVAALVTNGFAEKLAQP